MGAGARRRIEPCIRGPKSQVRHARDVTPARHNGNVSPSSEPTDPSSFLDWLVASVGQGAGDSQSGLYIPQSGQTYHAGTTAPLIGITMVTPPGAIAVPASSVASASDYWGVFLTLPRVRTGHDSAGDG